MTILQQDFVEVVGDHSPSTASFSLKEGRATMTLQVRVNRTSVQGATGDLNPDSEVLPDDLLRAPFTILGGINSSVGDGRLRRTLPLAHPQWPWLYADRIASVRGIGGPPVKLGSITPLEAVPLDYYALYSVYEFVVEFSSRNYAVLSDDDIDVPLFDKPWVDFDGKTAPQQDQTYASEWKRFTDYQTVPQNDWATGQIGSDFIYQTGDGTGPGANGGLPFMGMPHVLIPNEVIKLTWYSVPFRYYSSQYSYLRRFRGRINYLDFYDWKDGQLQFVCANPIRFTPPLLQPVNWLQGAQTVDKWCDIEMIFLATYRDGVNLPSQPANANYIVGGHNLLPWQGDRQFYYVQSKAKSVPLWASFPFQLLFTDPDANWQNPEPDFGGEPDVQEPDDVDPTV